jgi:hypothetical protein
MQREQNAVLINVIFSISLLVRFIYSLNVLILKQSQCTLFC